MLIIWVYVLHDVGGINEYFWGTHYLHLHPLR